MRSYKVAKKAFRWLKSKREKRKQGFQDRINLAREFVDE